MARKHDRRGARTVLTYVYLRSAARHAMSRGQAQARGATFDFMLATLATAFFLEAYLNHVGPEMVPDWRERAEPHRKLKSVAYAVGLKLERSGERFQAFNTIFRIRDALVHGRTHRLEGTWPSGRERLGLDLLQPEWERLANPDDAGRLLKHAETLVREIHAATGSSENPFSSLGSGGSEPNPKRSRRGTV